MLKIMLCLITGVVLANAAWGADAENKPIPYADKIKFVELDDSDCVAKDGKLIALEDGDPETAYEVWVDRWFMDVQTADHTKHLLKPGQEPTPLGCSMTGSGKQNWTLYSVKMLK